MLDTLLSCNYASLNQGFVYHSLPAICIRNFEFRHNSIPTMTKTASLRTPECGCKCTVCHINSEGYCTKTPWKLDLSTLNVSAEQGCDSCKTFANLIRSIAPKTDKVYICPHLVRAFGQPVRFTFSVRSDGDSDLSPRPSWLWKSYELFSLPGKISWRNLDSRSKV